MTDFDFKDFRSIKFEDRIKTLELKNFGDTSDIVTWKIRGLNSEDLAAIEDGLSNVKTLAAMADMLAQAISEAGTANDKIAAIKGITGLDGDTPSSLIRKYIIFERGSIEPNKPDDRADTVKFAKVYPAEFHRIVNEISTITNMGGSVKKKLPKSGEEKT